MGKSTLLQAVADICPGLRVCREGDYSPLELAWCTWMDETEYTRVLEQYETLEKEIRANTFQEGNRYIITYTRILTDIPDFHRDLEQYEIYNGRKTLAELEQIIFTRYRRFSGTGYLSECAFLQNIVEDLILFHCLSDDEIMNFYHRFYKIAERDSFLLLYLYSADIPENIRIIQKERSDSHGNWQWYPLMLQYLASSPYGKEHDCRDFDGLISHLKHRQRLELRIVKEIIGKQAVIFPAKQWKQEDILAIMS